MKPLSIVKDKRYLLARMGDISQLAGLRRYELADGKARGVEAVDFRTGTGFEFTVLPGRGMDIAWAFYQGVPLAYMSKTGITAPAYYESEGINWLRSFYAGLLTTCGLTNAGWPSEYDEPAAGVVRHGLHGRVANAGAEQVCVREEWDGGVLRMSVSGRMREAMLHCENLTLRREIASRLGENELHLVDVIENAGFSPRPLMILYHINIGYPLLDEGSRLLCNPRSTESADDVAAADAAHFRVVYAPTHGIKEKVYFHDMPCRADGTTAVGVVNERLEVGLYVRFNKSQLPEFTQWKQLGEAEYVMGLEPGNCIPIGLAAQDKRGRLERLQPGERKTITLDIGVLTGLAEIRRFEETLSELH
ncbi:MAG TPA: aldose 1-epimerase family protein [Phycisphaerae bacterium]|nr:aldose 1-epimerase family protein [Phycisphaerae bacterium]